MIQNIKFEHIIIVIIKKFNDSIENVFVFFLKNIIYFVINSENSLMIIRAKIKNYFKMFWWIKKICSIVLILKRYIFSLNCFLLSIMIDKIAYWTIESWIEFICLKMKKFVIFVLKNVAFTNKISANSNFRKRWTCCKMKIVQSFQSLRKRNSL